MLAGRDRQLRKVGTVRGTLRTGAHAAIELRPHTFLRHAEGREQEATTRIRARTFRNKGGAAWTAPHPIGFTTGTGSPQRPECLSWLAFSAAFGSDPDVMVRSNGISAPAESAAG